MLAHSRAFSSPGVSGWEWEGEGQHKNKPSGVITETEALCSHGPACGLDFTPLPSPYALPTFMHPVKGLQKTLHRCRILHLVFPLTFLRPAYRSTRASHGLPDCWGRGVARGGWKSVSFRLHPHQNQFKCQPHRPLTASLLVRSSYPHLVPSLHHTHPQMP